MASTDLDNSNLMLMLNQVKRIDMRTSMDIAGLGNCPVRDHNGNLLPFVWTRQSFNNEHENASLLTRDVLQKHLSSFIDSNINENIDMLRKVGDPALLVDWLVRTTEHWEQRYAQKRDEKYDVSQIVLSAMLETIVDQVLPTLQTFCEFAMEQFETQLLVKFEELKHSPLQNPYHQQLLKSVSCDDNSVTTQNLESFFWLHRGQHALVRFLFRLGLQLDVTEVNAVTEAQQTIAATFLQHICIITGKLLQKKEVCNKAGAYSSLRQRSDVLQELNNVIINFRLWVQTVEIQPFFDFLHEILRMNTWIFYVVDHTSVPVTLTHIKKANVPQDTSVKCPECQTTFKPAYASTNTSVANSTQNVV